ncbi:hypothetical protein TIFTF001_006897 [Ficus carica]|uniref:Uncharacterized protein n=1 Tax=Ficus carica TaxID=3494 RepID=A0AA87ZS62_FICCA|nr:hypothetical protein TIFTF001_006897 [Ficus carica]
MVSDAELVERLRDILRCSDLDTTTPSGVRRQLEHDFAVDLSDRKAFIRDQIDLFLESHMANPPEQEPEPEPAAEEEEEAEDEDEDEDDEDDNGGKGRRKGGSTKADKDVKKKGGGGFAKLCSLSPQLQTFIGEAVLARTEVVKKLWSYIKENSLQDPKNKQNIICDESLRALFHVDRINMFQMNKALAKHIWPLNVDNAVTENSSQKEKQSKQEQEEEEEEEEEEDSDEPKQKEKRQKKGGSGLLAPLPLSDALVKFLGTGENALSRADVVKRMWEYIKQHDLQDPSDKRRIICDDKLKELFDVDTFNGFSVSKLLTAHFVKAE